MKRKNILLSIALAFIMCLSLAPVTVLAAALPAGIGAPLNPKAALDDDVPEYYIDFTDDIIISLGLDSAFLTKTQDRRSTEEMRHREVVQHPLMQGLSVRLQKSFPV